MLILSKLMAGPTSRYLRSHPHDPFGHEVTFFGTLPGCPGNKKATHARGFLDLVGRARFELATNGLKVDITYCFYLCCARQCS
jgi:hypothetical protein